MKKLTIAVALTIALGVSGPSLAGGGTGGGSSGGGSLGSSGPSYDPVVEYQKGVEAYQAGDFKAAEKAMKKVVKAVPKDANSHYILGRALLEQDETAKAISSLKTAVKFNPALYDAQAKLGVAYVTSGKPEEADKIVATLEASKANCGAGCADGAAIDQAIAEIAAAKSGTSPTQSVLPSAYSFASARTGDAQYSGALRQINLGQYDVGIRDLTALQAQMGPHPDILTYIGFAHRKQGNFDRALTFYSAALTIDPNHLSANEYLGEAYVEQGDLASANAQLAKLETLCPFGCAQTEELRRWIRAANS